jgi:hypothetical protein
MKTFAEIQDGVVVNTSVWEQDPQLPNFVEITGIENVGSGWSFVDGQWVEPPLPPSQIPVTEV